MNVKADQMTRIFTALFICFIVTCPINNCYEIFAMMNGTLAASASALGVSAWSVTLTPTYVRTTKDLFVIFSALLVLLRILKSPAKSTVLWSRPLLPLNLFVAIIALCALLSFTFMPATVVLMGVRGYWSILLIYAGALFCDLSEKKIYRFVIGVFCLQVILQAIQFATDAGYKVYFEHRSPGFFIIPSTAGAFAVLTHYFAIRFKSNLLKIASLVSLMFSNSTTGFLCVVAYYVYTYRNRFKPKVIYYPLFLGVVASLGYVLIINIGTITGRGGGSSYSLLVRLGLIYLALTNWSSLLLGQGMGIATSQAFLYGYSGAVIADNTYLGILYNAGIVPAIVMLIFVVGSFRYADNKLLYLLFLCYSMTTVIFEINPVVQIVLILFGMQIGRRYARRPAKRRVRPPSLVTLTSPPPELFPPSSIN